MVYLNPVIKIEAYPLVGIMAQEIVKGRKLCLFLLKTVELFLQVGAHWYWNEDVINISIYLTLCAGRALYVLGWGGQLIIHKLNYFSDCEHVR